MKQCNYCTNKKCDVIRMHRAKKRILSIKEMRSSCPRHRPPGMFTEKLLLLAMGTNPQGVHDVLKATGFRIQELAERPYFKLILDENSGGKKKKRYGHGRNRKRTDRDQRVIRGTQRAVPNT